MPELFDISSLPRSPWITPIIWCSDIVETRHDIPGAWWGRYTYSASFAVLLAQCKTVALVQINWRDHTLYEWPSPDSIQTGPLAGHVTFYDGTQTEPDPLINAAMEGNAPIYRGHSYVVLKDVPLTELFNDSVPHDLKFDVMHWREVVAQ